MSDMTRRDHYICAALTGFIASKCWLAGEGETNWKPDEMGIVAAKWADAALAAAGEKEDPVLHEDCISIDIHNAVMDRLQADFDKLHAEIARLKRQAEPLDDAEVRLASAGLGVRTTRDWDRAITAIKSRRK